MFPIQCNQARATQPACCGNQCIRHLHGVASQIVTPERSGAPRDLVINIKQSADTGEHLNGMFFVMIRNPCAELSERDH
jgi:hypothetical protein